ncbi:MAG: hypothetical protein D6730_23485 [Bacteroidetes bacterium]|nr:MAG: hypothetical protein D6730_23485 [Bacteroidota bacterium]
MHIFFARIKSPGLYSLGSLLLVALLTGFSHPLYLSICQIYFNPQHKSLEISAKLFTEDLVLALENEGVGPLYLGEEREADSADVYIGAYLQKQLQIKVNGRPVNFRYLGKEVELDVSWCYLEAEGVEEVKEIEITNRFFMELFEPQKNIVHVRVGKEEKSIMLQKGRETQLIAF